MSVDSANRDIILDGYYALGAAVLDINQLFALRPPPVERGGHLVSDSAIPTLLQAICVNMGMAWMALFDDGSSETTGWLKRAKAARAAAVRAILQDVDVQALAVRAIRNKMVHPEDHILRIDRRRPQAAWIINLGMTSRGLINSGPDTVYSRVFIFDENRLLHLEEEFDLAAYRAQANAAVLRLGDYLGLIRAEKQKTPAGEADGGSWPNATALGSFHLSERG